jgi:hypothetical protein
MTNPFEDDKANYLVLVNEEGQHLLRPAFIDIPAVGPSYTMLILERLVATMSMQTGPTCGHGAWSEKWVGEPTGLSGIFSV